LMKLQYAVVFEQTPNNYGAYAPDVPGCISTGKTWDEIQEMMREAIALYIEATLEEGDPVPEPRMSLEDAISYHCQVLSQVEDEGLPESGDDWPPVLSITFAPIEVEVAAPQAVAGN
jgi:predicted RNase H-like HicB family nuclease